LDFHLPIVLGDALFNTHSALDHLIVAIAPKKRKAKAGFPIYPSDPLARNETSGDYLNHDARSRWESMTKGLPSDCVAILKGLQPHAAPERWGEGVPADHPLAILSALHNADKHRNLVTVVSALANPEARIDGAWSHMEHLVPNAALKNDAVIHRSKRAVDVYVEGSAVIGVGRPDEVRDLAHIIDSLTKYIGSEVLPQLEPFLPGVSTET
jgi:hypothetical protein